jgi:tRNA G18 (ribose-2'-O)-methylase SpoU
MTLERELKKDVPEDEFLISTQDTQEQKSIVPERPTVHIVLDNLRSSFNVGSLFRSAEAFGATKIHLCGYTATPENSKTAKAALGAHNWVDWQYWENTLSCLDELKDDDFTIIAFETTKGATPLHQIKITPKQKVCLVLGNERYGLAAPTLKRAHTLVEIPLAGRKNSLNVGVCGALAMEHFLRA